MRCPRRLLSGPYGSRIDDFRHDHTCNFCGSLTGDKFMELIKGSARLGATDKSYKVYVHHEDHKYAKFYFEHLSEEQMLEFIQLFNNKTLKFEGGQPFYILPYFIKIGE